MTSRRAAHGRGVCGQGAGKMWPNAGNRADALARAAGARQAAGNGMAHAVILPSHQESAMARSIAIVEDEPAIRANYVEALTRFWL